MINDINLSNDYMQKNLECIIIEFSVIIRSWGCLMAIYIDHGVYDGYIARGGGCINTITVVNIISLDISEV